MTLPAGIFLDRWKVFSCEIEAPVGYLKDFARFISFQNISAVMGTALIQFLRINRSNDSR